MGRVINLTFALQSPKERFYGNQLILEAKRRCHNQWPLLFAVVFVNGFDNCETIFRILHGDDSPMLCTNLVSFCPVTSEIITLKCIIFGMKWQKLANPTFILHTGIRNRLQDCNSDICRLDGYMM